MLRITLTPAYNKRKTRDAGYNSYLTHNYFIHWDVVGFTRYVEEELFAKANAYGEEVGVF